MVATIGGNWGVWLPGATTSTITANTIPICANNNAVYFVWRGDLCVLDSGAQELRSISTAFTGRGFNWASLMSENGNEYICGRYLDTTNKIVYANRVKITSDGVASVETLGTTAATATEYSHTYAAPAKVSGEYKNIYNREYQSGTMYQNEVAYDYHNNISATASLGYGGVIPYSDTRVAYIKGGNTASSLNNEFVSLSYNSTALTPICTFEDSGIGGIRGFWMYEGDTLTASFTDKTTTKIFVAQYDTTDGHRVWKTQDFVGPDGTNCDVYLLGKYLNDYYAIVIEFEENTTHTTAGATYSHVYLVQIRGRDGGVTAKKEISVPNGTTIAQWFNCNFSGGTGQTRTQYIPRVTHNGYFVIGNRPTADSNIITTIKVKIGASHSQNPTI